MREYIRRTKGIAILAALVAILILEILAAAYLYRIKYEFINYTRYVNSVKAYYLALSGVKYMGGNDLFNHFGYKQPVYPITKSITVEDLSLPDYEGTFSATRSGSNETYVISLMSTGTVSGTSETIKVEAGGEEVMDYYTNIVSYINGFFIEDLPVIKWKEE